MAQLENLRMTTVIQMKAVRNRAAAVMWGTYRCYDTQTKVSGSRSTVLTILLK